MCSIKAACFKSFEGKGPGLCVPPSKATNQVSDSHSREVSYREARNVLVIDVPPHGRKYQEWIIRISQTETNCIGNRPDFFLPIK